MQEEEKRMKIRKSWLAAGMILAVALSPARADEPIKFGSTPNPVGSGGRAVAWGGAFIAVADDATAASWNPAGLVQLETPECSVVFSYLDRGESMDFERGEAAASSEVASHADINYASVVYPFHIGKVNLVPSLNYQRLYELDRRMEFNYTREPDLLPGKGWLQTQGKAKIEQVGALTTVTPALAAQITPKISLGISVNFWGLDPWGDGWKTQVQQRSQETVSSPDPLWNGATDVYTSERNEEFRLSGLNWNWQAGFLVKPGNFTIGGVYKSSFDADLVYDYEEVQTWFWTKSPGPVFTPPYYIDHPYANEHWRKLTWPASYGLGVGYRFSDALSMALDVNRTEWSKFKLKPEQGKAISPIAMAGGVVRDTTQVRGGMEYLIIKPKVVVALRGGGFYDPEPRAGEQAEFYGVSLGTGFGMGHFVADFAYQFRFGQDVLVDKSDSTIGEIRADVFDRFLVASLIYHF